MAVIIANRNNLYVSPFKVNHASGGSCRDTPDFPITNVKVAHNDVIGVVAQDSMSKYNLGLSLSSLSIEKERGVCVYF
ncbi:hypothetical protein [Lederbergia lenta]|uniref:hypothetical protein n=1 Tax=Lederbergia lenta TaxID=1467 RepID=UPI00203CE068|nr:hypothetical protein [Lederbergia lenta]MCM3112824.1 hypothetical protein [Lederbergia lenta]